MSRELRELLEKIKELPLFESIDFTNISASNSDGDNALHVVARWGDVAAAQLLLDAGIEIDKRGDLGCTPLHEACSGGHEEMVALLVKHGANLFAQSEGDVPFTVARKMNHDKICDFLGPLMVSAQMNDSKLWIRNRIDHLKSEIARLEQILDSADSVVRSE